MVCLKASLGLTYFLHYLLSETLESRNVFVRVWCSECSTTLLQSTSTLPLRDYPPCQFLSREWWLTRLSGGETLVPGSLWSLFLKISWWMGLSLSSDCLLELGLEEGTSLNSVNEMPGDRVFPAPNCWILGSLGMCQDFHPRERLF